MGLRRKKKGRLSAFGQVEKLKAGASSASQAAALQASLQAAKAARRARARYSMALKRAIKEYGDLPRGQTHVSGIYNADFPDTVKDQLRGLLREVNGFTDRSLAEYRRSGKRTPWRDSPFAAIARPQGSFY